MISPSNSLLNPQRSKAFRSPTVGDFLNAVDAGLTSAGFEVSDVCETSLVAKIGDIEFHVEFGSRGAQLEAQPEEWDEVLGRRNTMPLRYGPYPDFNDIDIPF